MLKVGKDKNFLRGVQAILNISYIKNNISMIIIDDNKEIIDINLS